MPILMVQGNKSFLIAIHNWLTEHFDCVIRPYEFAFYQFLWLIAISMGDAGQLYNETVLYHYLYKNESSKGQMEVKCYAESEILRSVLAKLVFLKYYFIIQLYSNINYTRLYSLNRKYFISTIWLRFYSLNKKLFILILFILDTEWNEEYNFFTMMCVIFYFWLIIFYSKFFVLIFKIEVGFWYEEQDATTFICFLIVI